MCLIVIMVQKGTLLSLHAVKNHPGVTDIATLMDSWTSQTGYPVITINTSNGEIYQKPFMSNDSSEPKYVVLLHQYWHHYEHGD